MVVWKKKTRFLRLAEGVKKWAGGNFSVVLGKSILSMEFCIVLVVL
jgi:hypothetical protein